MGAALFVIVLVTVTFFLVQQSPATASAPDTPFSGISQRLSRLAGWQRHTLILLASATAAFLVMRELLTGWFAIATKISVMLGIGPGVFTLLLLGGIAIVAIVLRSRSKASTDVASAPPATAIQTPATPDDAKASRSGIARVALSALLAVILLVAGFFLYPALSPYLTGTKVEPAAPTANQSATATKEPTPASPAPSEAQPASEAATNAERDWAVLDKALVDLVDATMAARVAHRDMATHLADRLARARSSGDAAAVERWQGIIADRDKAAQDAREKARAAMTTIAAETAADSNVRPAYMTATGRMLVMNNPPVEAFLWQIYRIEFPPSEPDRFMTPAIAAWEKAVAPAQFAATRHEPRSDQPRFANPVSQRQPFARSETRPEQGASSPSESPRYSRESGSAWSRRQAQSQRQERTRRMTPLPSEELE